MIDDVRERAKALLASGEVAAVVGWRAGRREDRPVPFVARCAADCERLILNPFCRGGLAEYVRREAAAAPLGVVACRHDIRALRVLAQEKQLDAERIRVIGYDCDIPGNPVGKVVFLEGSRLGEFPVLGGCSDSDAAARELARLRALTPSERWAHWRSQFDKCVRCYACRAACPMCYCAECVVDRNLPQWIETTASPRGNFAWNLIRAWHLAGRCVGCGACARACPEGIRIDVLNLLLADEIRGLFGCEAGVGDSQEAAFFASFKETDDESFILEE